MKAATGELNLTIVTVIAVGLILTFFVTILWPSIQAQISDDWTDVASASAYVEVINIA